MSQLIPALRQHAAHSSLRIAIQDDNVALTYAELILEIERLAARLREASPRMVAILADNGTAWALTDLAAQLAGIPIIPLPLFFSASQIVHVIRIAGIDRIITDQPQRLFAALAEEELQTEQLQTEPFHAGLKIVRLAEPQGGSAIPQGTRKISFTSGTTGEPKGVCLGEEEMEAVAESLRVASSATNNDRHLCVLPLATLLENIGGIYTPLLAGATICLPRLADVGLSGSSGLDVGRLIAALGQWKASSAIMVPQMLQAIVAAGQNGTPMPTGLRYLAVGGAPVSRSLLDAAWELGLPVHEGYGLSECASVVAVGRPGEHRPGSVGRPLPHLRIELADDEILIKDITWRGYLGDEASYQSRDCIATGDLGYLDADGFLYLTGRKKNIFITSFGRNVAPEWVESELTSHFPILQAAVFGEARPFNSAVVFAHPAATSEAITAAIAQANSQLPDYARIRSWVAAKAPFTAANAMATPNGRLRRNHIEEAYRVQIDALYQCQTESEIHELLPTA